MTLNLKKMAEEAATRPDILPKLTFGPDKHAIVRHLVTVTDVAPREITWEEDGVKIVGLAVDVRVEETSDTGPSAPQVGGSYTILMRADPKHGLSGGILKTWHNNGRSLEGVRLAISTRNYDHEKYGLTRGYIVQVMGVPNALP